MTDRDQPGMYEGDFQSLTTDDQFRKNVENQFQAFGIRLSNQDVAIAAVKTDIADVKSEVSQNTKLTQQIATDTGAILAAWNDGVAAKRFFCRMAEAWRFLLKQVMLPFGVPILALYGFWYYTTYKEFPGWISAVFKVFMAIV